MGDTGATTPAVPQRRFGLASALALVVVMGAAFAATAAILLGVSVAVWGRGPLWVGVAVQVLLLANPPGAALVAFVKSGRMTIAIGAAVIAVLFMFVQTFIFLVVGMPFGLGTGGWP